MTHDPHCTGCPECSALARAILAEPLNLALRDAMANERLRPEAERKCLAAERRAVSPRTASGFLLRASEAHPPRGTQFLRTNSQVATEFARRAVPAPDPYASAAMRAAERPEAFAYVTHLFNVHALPPDGYAIALALRTIEEVE